jgi:hypothetical protein
VDDSEDEKLMSMARSERIDHTGDCWRGWGDVLPCAGKAAGDVPDIVPSR